MELNYELFNDRVLLKKIDEPIEEKTESGIILPLETQEKAQRNKNIFSGEIVLTGIDTKLVGKRDVVIFNLASATKLFLDGNEYYLLGEQMLLGKKK